MKGKEGLQLSRVEEVQFNSSDSDFEARPGEEASARARLRKGWLPLLKEGLSEVKEFMPSKLGSVRIDKELDFLTFNGVL